MSITPARPGVPAAFPLVASGTAVIAVTYGLGRYAYGLFVPELQLALGLSATQAGVVGGVSHVGYAAGLLTSPWLTRRTRPGTVTTAAAVVTTLGMASIASSIGPNTLGAGVLVAALGSGAASPALAQLVVQQLPPTARSPAQTWINSGTSLGLAVSAPAILLAVSWRTTWAMFAAAAFVVGVVAHRAVGPGRAGADAGPSAAGAPSPGAGLSADARSGPRGTWPRRARGGGPLGYAFLLGATSAAYWTFSRQQVLDTGSSEAWSVGFWVVIGGCGLLGGTAGAFADRVGLTRSLQAWSIVWACALGSLALPSLPTPVAMVSAGGFGAAYMALTGLIILWAAAWDGDAASGVRAGFLALGVGQAMATPVAGVLADARGLPAAFAVSAVASVTLLYAATRAA